MTSANTREVAVPRGTGARPLPWSTTSELVSEAARLHGDRDFLRDGDGAHLDFTDFDRLTRRLADLLVEQGLQPGDRVAIMQGNSVAWPVTWMAIVRAGGVAVPANKRYRPTDLGFVLSDAGVRFVVCDDEAFQVVASCRSDCPSVTSVMRVVVADGDVSLETLWEAEVPPLRPAEDPAEWDRVTNLQFTSGTTGFPKACVLPEDYWLRMGLLAAEVAELTADDVVLTTQPYSYIDPQWQTTMCLVAGATLVVLPRFSAREYWAAVREHGATFLYVLGTMPVILFKQPPSPLDRGHRVRLVLASGINPSMHRSFEERWGAPWREVFGMTETGIDLAALADDVETVGSGVAGRPVATKQVMVVGADRRPVPPGEIGEMLVKGEPLMLRYHRRPDETERAMTDGWFNTGDLVRQDEGGWISVVGRNKDMVRRAGENIAAAEVEAIVAGHPDVAMCAVVPVSDEVMEEEVKVFVQLRPGVGADPTATAVSIIEHAKERLAVFKVPRFVEFIDAFPLTPSERVSKPQLSREDPRVGAYDATVGRWL
jgi:acyl-CoA synthetase (AMP-forming)/AMP-acid ligase II